MRYILGVEEGYQLNLRAVSDVGVVLRTVLEDRSGAGYEGDVVG